ncbi:aminotransferase class III-fold pyridoxal phosphate-dependent enzyme [Rhizobium leguminosarum]|nr:aminotransferase class III-fold pyridoxal phosphate-dependent enzyme [Rhizobium leguminosarum]TAV52011.1 aminotransferase class III-fold pyridoxal phosphate-dependent enzyme [Rhizobium leguminosarum]
MEAHLTRKLVAIVQARMGSTRLPNKVMKPIGGTPMIGLLLERLDRAQNIDRIVIATSDDPRNDPLDAYVSELGFAVFRGSENDVLDRYYRAAAAVGATDVARITGDCPFVDPALVDECAEAYIASGSDYLSNVAPPTYADGLDIEIFSFAALERAWRDAPKGSEREHVTPYIRESGKFTTVNKAGDIDFSDSRWTIDTPEDFEVASAVFRHFHPQTDFRWRQILELSKERPELFAANNAILRNEGMKMGTGQKLWQRAKRVIPGGNTLLSKRAEMFLPDQWPAYFSKSKGCRVWDLDGNEYIDMSLMGVGTNTLGYGHPEVDEAVLSTVRDGNMSTLNCPEEVYLAEKLIEINPWADMVRFARSGGEANAIAIRIARAASGRDKVAVCGYHGWHDWYLSANLGEDESLAGHLLPGLEPRGVPRNLRGTVYPFNYNDFQALEALTSVHDIGVIKMEVVRNKGPEDNFLQKVRDLATRKGIVLIFDECTSGFRETFGGLYKKYGVEPDMAVFGKTLGNGYAVTATVGRAEVMEAAQSTFISSTFWTERVGSAAALKTLEVMERERSWETITAIGGQVTMRWETLAKEHGVSITTAGLPSLSTYAFNSPNALAYKTFVTQEMLAKGYLASTNFYSCVEHRPELIDGYFEALDPIFATIRECEDGRDIMSLLNGPVCHAGFRRLN